MLCCREYDGGTNSNCGVEVSVVGLRKRHGKSMSLIEVFQFLGLKQIVDLQLLNKRFYGEFAYALIRSVIIFRPRGISLQNNASSLRLLEVSAKGYAWKDFPVGELGEDPRTRRQFFKGKAQLDQTLSRIVQANSSQVYIIGGYSGYPSLIGRDYDVERSCLKADL